jgi:endonuclease YncB( thermonuclease family)
MRGPTPSLRTLVLVVALAALLSGCGDADDRAVDGTDRASTTSQGPVGTEPPTTAEVPDTTASTATAPTSAPPTTAPATTMPSAPTPGVVVIEVVDGDTIVVAGGQRVRMIGIDTPERGQCGYYEATAALTALVGLRPVVLVGGARDDVDRYGRLLRYVEVDGVDANLEMLRNGHARARYDSRDGYGRHAREDLYVAADLAMADRCSVLAPPSTLAPAPVAPLLAPGGTDPRFGTCREAIAAGFGPYVRGVDPEYDWYRDADGDGVVCE